MRLSLQLLRRSLISLRKGVTPTNVAALHLSKTSFSTTTTKASHQQPTSQPKKTRSNKQNENNAKALENVITEAELEMSDVQYNENFVPTSLNQWRLLSHVYSPLDSMVAVRISGSDATKILHSLTTQNIPEVLESSLHQNRAFYTTWLTPKGRLAFDSVVLIEESPKSPLETIAQPAKTLATSALKRSHQLAANAYEGGSYLVLVHQSCADGLIAHIREHSLRVKSSIAVATDVSLFSVVSGIKSSLTDVATFFDDSIRAGTLPKGTFSVTDPRMIGKRVVSMIVAVPSPEGKVDINVPAPFIRVDESVYDAFRVLHGLPQVGSDLAIGKNLPLECNMAEINGVKFDKGCYLGQELTARTHYKGLIRKRVVPFYYRPVGSDSAEFCPKRLSLLQNTLANNIGADSYANSLFPYGFLDASLYRAPIDADLFQPDLDPESPLYDFVKEAMAFDFALAVQASIARPQHDDSLVMIPAPTSEQMSAMMNSADTNEIDDQELGDDFKSSFDMPEPIPVGKVLSTNPLLNIGFALVRVDEAMNPVGRVVIEPQSNADENDDVIDTTYEAVFLCPEFLMEELKPETENVTSSNK